MQQITVVTGASSGFGLMSVKALAKAGHVVYAGMRETQGRNAPQAETVARFAVETGTDLRVIEMDVISDASVEAAVRRIIDENGRLDVVVHNAGHMSFGPSEAFTPEQFAALYDVNVLGAQRVNRAALPQMRRQRRGVLVWVSSSSARGGTPPFLGPYFAAKAAMDSLAVTYAGELSRWGIETSIIVPGAFTKGTNHFLNAGSPGDTHCAQEYAQGPTADIADRALKGLATLVPDSADPEAVARAIAEVVNMPHGTRPFRVHIDPAEDGAEIVNGVADRMRRELLFRIGLEELLSPA